jgi:chaperonin GroEL
MSEADLTSKMVRFGEENRTALLEGVNTLSNAVRTTLGPKGRNVIIQVPLKQPVVTKDGVTVAQEVMLDDPLENMGAQMVLEAARRTNTDAGDGTTTATVLTQAIITEGLKLVTAGMNPMDLKRGIDATVEVIADNLDKQSQPCTSKEDLENVASLSANSDRAIGEKIADALMKVGTNGAVSVDIHADRKDHVEIVKGCRFDRGYMSPYFSNNLEDMTIVHENALILLYDKKITTLNPLIKLFEQVATTGLALIIIAEDIEPDALNVLVQNHTSGAFKVAAVVAPGYADRRLPILEDIATLTGGNVISDELNRSLEDAQVTDLGKAERVEIGNLFTTIIGGRGDPEKIKERITLIKNHLFSASNDHNANKLKERLSSMDGGVAIIKAGGSSKIEAMEKKDRYVDSLHATSAAREQGIVPGGGVALLNAVKDIQVSDLNLVNLDQEAGAKIVLKAVEAPIRQITSNAGGAPDVVVDSIFKSTENTFGYDAATDSYGNMYDLGIIDPVKVTRSALLNASSVAGLLITSECSLTDIMPVHERLGRIKNEKTVVL